MPQHIRDVMTSNPCTIDANESVAYAAKMMREEDVGLAPIVEGDKLIGMLTDRDIATRVTADGRDPDQVKVRDVASTQLVTIDPQQDLDDALRKMAKHQVRRLPVVDQDGRLVGVVAQADIARTGDDSKTGQLVEEISESGGQMSSIEEGQFPRQVDDQLENRLVSQEGEPVQLEEQREEEGVSKVQAASSRGRKRRSTSRKRKTAGTRARSTTRKSSGGSRKRKTTSRKKSSTGTRKRKTTSRKRKTTSRKRSTGRTTVKTAGRRGGRKTAAKKRSTARKRKTTARKKTTGARKRKTTSRKRSTGTRKRKTTARKKTTGTRKRKTTARRKTTGTRKRKTSARKKTGTRKRSTAKRSTARRSTASRKTSTRRRTTRRKTR